MPTVKVANFVFVAEQGFTIPAIRTSQSGKKSFRSDEVLDFELPKDTRPRGILTFDIDTVKGADQKVDVAFNVIVNHDGGKHTFTFGDVYVGMQVQVHNLKPGKNFITFKTTKAGTVKQLDPDVNQGGHGLVSIRHVCLHHHRDVVL